MEFDVLNILYYLAVILILTKLLGMFTRKIGLPQVVGMIIAGILLDPNIWHNFGTSGLIDPSAAEMNVLKSFSEIGVVFILFSSGLETNLEEVKKSGAAATAIACVGVVLPIALGTTVALLFMGGLQKAADTSLLMNALFIGCILAATSVGITVETLRELGRLNTKTGTTILSAAIIDDVLGVLALSFLSRLKGGGNILVTLLKTLGFFVFAVGGGKLLRMLFKWLVIKYPHRRRTSIFAIAMCFMYAFIAERVFGIAAITGAYMAGFMLSGLDDTSFVDRKVVVSGYMLFTPLFFAYIGISADFGSFKLEDIAFAVAFVTVGIIGKIVGCGLVARAFKFKPNKALTVGCGMVARGEVALAIYAAGNGFIAKGGIDPLIATIFLILISSVLCPLFLKLCINHKGHTPEDHVPKEIKTRISAEAYGHD